MIQRIQSVYLALVFILSGILIWLFPLWIGKDKVAFFTYQAFNQNSMLIMSITLVFCLSALLAVASLLKFKNRKSQFMLNRLNLIFNLYLLGVLLYYLLSLSGETLVSEKGIGALFPVLNIFLLVFANKAIQKDETLVKSVDRLR